MSSAVLESSVLSDPREPTTTRSIVHTAYSKQIATSELLNDAYTHPTTPSPAPSLLLS